MQGRQEQSWGIVDWLEAADTILDVGDTLLDVLLDAAGAVVEVAGALLLSLLD